jgi:hypothetical protein
VIEGAGIDAFVYKESTVEHFSARDWEINIENACMAKAIPTPESEIFEGARADGLPVAPTTLEWCTIRTENKG